MERYRILPHTADGKFQAFGRTLEEAFGNAALAMVSLMWDWAGVEPKIARDVRLAGRDREQLLVKFLGEILYLLDAERFLLASVDGPAIRETAEGWALEAVFRGDTLTGQYETHGDVKAVTYHEMRIEEGDGVTLQVVVDM